MGLDFYHHICNTCHSTPGKFGDKTPKFQSCAGCKLVSYCCRSHQKSDWKQHKGFCLQVQKLLFTHKRSTLFSDLDGMTHQTLYNYQSKLVEVLEKELKRNLTFCERSMIYFPDICGMCLQPNGSSFISCGNCNLQFYCCIEDLVKHSDTHKKDCEPLKICFELFQFLSSNVNHQPSKVCMKELTVTSVFPPTLDEYLSTFMETDRLSIFDRVIFSDILSYLLTIVYVIDSCDELKIKSKLCIHFVGSTVIESYILTILDILFYWLESVECLDLVFVGPDCPQPNEDYVHSIYKKHSNKRLTLSFHPQVLYHELCLGDDGVASPDMIVAFNCGFHEFKGQNCDTWGKTIEFLLTMENVVLVTTSYTLKEAEEDSQPFISYSNVDVLKLCQSNPFKSLNPHRNPERSESAIFFFNQFISAFSMK